MRNQIVIVIALSLLSLCNNVVADQSDRAIDSRTTEVALFSEVGPELSMQVAVNSKGIPIELKFKIKNIFNFPVQLYFPRDKDAFAKGIYIVGADNFGYKPREMAGKPISETFEYFGLTPNEEMIWEYEVEDLVLSFDEHIKMRGFVRVSFASLLYLDKDNSGIENFMNFERLRARVTWNGDIKQ